MYIQSIPQTRPASPGRLPRNSPVPRILLTTSIYRGISMRPNLDATIPAISPYCASPDIWIAGAAPVPGYRAALATPNSFRTISGNVVAEHATNFVYVRGRNNTPDNLSRTVQLYYAPPSIIPWPDRWIGNVIQTDRNQPMALISNLAPGITGVADAGFPWSPAQPLADGGQYCLLAQLNDPTNPAFNPVPTISSQIDMSALICNNPGWAWRNTRDVPAGSSFSYTAGVTIPSSIPAGTAKYYISAAPTGYTGWSMSLTLSEPDANGRIVQLPTTPIGEDGVPLGAFATLEPGYAATATISLTSNGHHARPGASIPLSIHYDTGVAGVEPALARGLIDLRTTMLARKGAFGGPAIGPVALIPLGDFTAVAAA